MVRPLKDPNLRMDFDLRIPLTHEQKMLVSEAATLDQSDVAAWCRPILLKAAEARLKREKGRQKMEYDQ